MDGERDGDNFLQGWSDEVRKTCSARPVDLRDPKKKCLISKQVSTNAKGDDEHTFNRRTIKKLLLRCGEQYYREMHGRLQFFLFNHLIKACA